MRLGFESIGKIRVSEDLKLLTRWWYYSSSASLALDYRRLFNLWAALNLLKFVWLNLYLLWSCCKRTLIRSLLSFKNSAVLIWLLELNYLLVEMHLRTLDLKDTLRHEIDVWTWSRTEALLRLMLESVLAKRRANFIIKVCVSHSGVVCLVFLGYLVAVIRCLKANLGIRSRPAFRCEGRYIRA